MTYLLDINACIALINGRPEAVRRRFTRVSAGDDVIATSSVVLSSSGTALQRASAPRRTPSGSPPSCQVRWRLWTSQQKTRSMLAAFAQPLKGSAHPSAPTTFSSPAKRFGTRRHWLLPTRRSSQECEVFGCRTGRPARLWGHTYSSEADGLSHSRSLRWCRRARPVSGG